MRRHLLAVTVFVVASLAAISFASTIAFDQDATVSAASTCLTKHCPAHTHCCYGCTGNAICVRNGVPCPECAPQ